jgi:hypothetical protein
MEIEKINSGLPTTTKIESLNDMIVQVDGEVNQAKFDKNELDQLFTDTKIPRKFLRRQSIGNTVATYSNWTYLAAENGYSIWKYAPTTYTHDALNALFLNGKAITNKGLASAESATTFVSVFFYNGSTYTNNTTEAGTEGGTAFSTLEDASDFIYIGAAAKFHGAKFEFGTRASNITLKVEYYNGAWTQLTHNANDLTDNTSNLQGDGAITWDTSVDAGWTTTTINSVNQYWIRISTTTVPVTVPTIKYLIPNSSVIGLLTLSSDEVLAEAWAFCSYSTSLYVTIRNAGNPNTEGDYYITSTSSDANKQNFFIYNNQFTADYLNSGYAPGLPNYADNTAAKAAGLTDGNFYRTTDAVKVVHP